MRLTLLSSCGVWFLGLSLKIFWRCDDKLLWCGMNICGTQKMPATDYYLKTNTWWLRLDYMTFPGLNRWGWLPKGIFQQCQYYCDTGSSEVSILAKRKKKKKRVILHAKTFISLYDTTTTTESSPYKMFPWTQDGRLLPCQAMIYMIHTSPLLSLSRG